MAFLALDLAGVACQCFGGGLAQRMHSQWLIDAAHRLVLVVGAGEILFSL